MAINNDKIEEYKALREEMIFTMQSRVWGNLAYGVITGGVAAGLFSISPALCMLLLIWGAIPFLSHNLFRELSRYRIAAYIRNFIEIEETGFDYEKHLTTLRAFNKNRSPWIMNFFDRSAFISSIYGLYIIIPGASMAWLIVNCVDPIFLWFGTIGFLILFLLIFRFEVLQRSYTPKKIDPLWQKICANKTVAQKE